MAVISFCFLGVSAATAAPVTGAAREAYAGEWRATACGAGADANAASFTMEFAMTGGLMGVNTGDETSGQHTVEAVDVAGDAVVLKIDGRDTWAFKRARDGSLVSGKPISIYSQMQGLTFRHCVKAADRGTIHLTRVQAGAISGAMPGGPVLIDLRAKKGCKALEYQYLNFDLVGPAGFTLHRWNSMALGEKLAGGGKPAFKTDDISDFRIEKADAIPGGYRFTLTEFIPPNGARGDTTTITVNVKGKTATIAEWKRSYALCTEPN
jgi:hypothetical protein